MDSRTGAILECTGLIDGPAKLQLTCGTASKYNISKLLQLPRHILKSLKEKHLRPACLKCVFLRRKNKLIRRFRTKSHIFF